MILVWIILVPLIGGLIAWLAARRSDTAARWLSLLALALDGGLVAGLWSASPGRIDTAGRAWLAELSVPWIPQFGTSLHLAVDGLSLVLIALTVFLGLIAVLCSWHEVSARVGFFHFNLLWVIAGILGVFLSLDLFLFYAFWELMLIPMYFLIAIWGHEDRIRASWKFFLFTQAGGLLMLLSILALYFLHGRETGIYTFDYELLLGTAMTPSTALWIMSGFFIAFAVKLPIIPLHTWLPDAHTEAPTAGSVVLAGLLLKTGAYGLLRFVLPLFPGASAELAPVAMGIAVAGILYGAVTAYGQTDLKRLVAYTSVSHMGFVLLGIFAGTSLALSGAVMQMVAHGISTGALFVIVGILQQRIHTRDLSRMGGFWSAAPRLSAMGLLFCLASLGLPGFGNFVAEFLVLVGTFRVSVPLTAIAATGLVLAAVYSLWIVQKVFHGEQAGGPAFADLSLRESFMLGLLAVAILWLGFHPAPVTGATGSVLAGILQSLPAGGIFR
jgi:NADH-quinone oxidoreductase subunit M